MIKFGFSAIVALTTISVVDARKGNCPRGMYWNMHTCQCLMINTCNVNCGWGNAQDPRYFCACRQNSEVAALFNHGYNEKCEKPQPQVVVNIDEPEEVIEKPLSGDISQFTYDIQPQCTLSQQECPNENFTVNIEKCACQCNIVCAATMSVDSDTCTCKPIETIEVIKVEEKETEAIKTCDSFGNKICPVAECEEGYFYDQKACICSPIQTCRKYCPRGQGLDPREICSCIDQSEIDALYRCEPDEDSGLATFIPTRNPHGHPHGPPHLRPSHHGRGGQRAGPRGGQRGGGPRRHVRGGQPTPPYQRRQQAHTPEDAEAELNSSEQIPFTQPRNAIPPPRRHGSQRFGRHQTNKRQAHGQQQANNQRRSYQYGKNRFGPRGTAPSRGLKRPTSQGSFGLY